MARFLSEWTMKEEPSMTVDLWIAVPEDLARRKRMKDGVLAYVDKVGLCVTITPTLYAYTGGTEKGWRIGLRNYPRFPEPDSSELLKHAENIGRSIAEIGQQGSFMIEEVGGATYWFTRRKGDLTDE